MVIGALSALLLAQSQLPIGRYQDAAEFPSLSWAKVDSRLANVGIAQSTAKRLKLQARVLWVDGTANMGAVDTPEKVEQLVKTAAEAGFNTLVFDVKPIVGYTLYPSKFSEQLTSWRTARFRPGYDPLRLMVASAKRHGLSLIAALNAFSEGHSYSKRDFGKPDNQFFKPGWGYDHPELQTWQYLPRPVLKQSAISDETFPVNSAPDAPATDRAISVCLNTVGAGDYFVALGADGQVVSTSTKPVSVPKNGSVFVGKGEGAEFLKQAARYGSLTMDSAADFKIISENQTQIPLMMNPHNRAVRDRALSFIREIVGNYQVDGVIYDDRLRFGGLNADFSPEARQLFEKKIKKQIKWPDDVYKLTYNTRLNIGPDGAAVRGIKPGPYFDAWLAWRVQEMASWVKEVRTTVDRTRKGTLFGVYQGSWYGDYSSYGSNYGSDELNAGFNFLTPAYRQSGFAKYVDYLITGCYYPTPTIYEALQKGSATGRTVEAGGAITNRVARDQTWSYAGIMISDYWTKKKDFERALQAAAATTQGVMVFDYSHRIEEFLPIFKRAFKTKAQAPHQVKGLLDKVREQRAAFDKAGYKDAPFPHLEGAPGAGF